MNIDLYNRQLHPNERASIERRKESYAKKNGLTVTQAEQELLTQANLMVQNGSPGQWNERAAKFLREERGMLPADGNSGPGYMFFATPDQKANPNMYAGYYANGADLNNPSAAQIDSSVSREQANRNAIGGATIAAATGGALIVGAPIAAAVGSTAFVAIGATTSGGMDAAGQYAQAGTIQPAQTLFAAATGAVTAPIGANVRFMGNVLLGGATGVANSIFNNTYYGESNSTLYAGGVGALAGAGGYLTGLATTQGLAQITRPFVYPNLDPKVPALLQGIRNPFPGFGGAMAGSVTQGASSFVPSKGDQK
jgi:filamentous hemagglutinin